MAKQVHLQRDERGNFVVTVPFTLGKSLETAGGRVDSSCKRFGRF